MSFIVEDTMAPYTLPLWRINWIDGRFDNSANGPVWQRLPRNGSRQVDVCVEIFRVVEHLKLSGGPNIELFLGDNGVDNGKGADGEAGGVRVCSTG